MASQDAEALQYLVVGMLAGSITVGSADFLNIDVEAPPVDEHGTYQPWFYIVGNKSGTRLKVEVSIAEEGGESSTQT